VASKCTGDKVRKAFWHAAKAPSKAIFDTNLATIHNTNLVAGNYLLQIPPKTWARYVIPNSRFDQITSNIAESINSA
jgi:hypothetical protein